MSSIWDFLPNGAATELYVSRVPSTIYYVLSSHKSEYLNAIKIFLTHTFHCRLCDPPDGNQGCFCLVASCPIRPSLQVTVAEKQERRPSHLHSNALHWKRRGRLLPTRHWLVLVTWALLRRRGGWEMQPRRGSEEETG